MLSLALVCRPTHILWWLLLWELGTTFSPLLACRLFFPLLLLPVLANQLQFEHRYPSIGCNPYLRNLWTFGMLPALITILLLSSYWDDWYNYLLNPLIVMSCHSELRIRALLDLIWSLCTVIFLLLTFYYNWKSHGRQCHQSSSLLNMIQYRKFPSGFRRLRVMHAKNFSSIHRVLYKRIIRLSILSTFVSVFQSARTLPLRLRDRGSSNELHSGQTSCKILLFSPLLHVHYLDLVCSKVFSDRSIPNNCHIFQHHFSQYRSLLECWRREQLLASFFSAQPH